MKSLNGGRWPWPLFLVLAYGITWGVQIPAYLYLVPRGIAPTNEANFLLLGSGGMETGTAIAVFLLCFSFGPSLAGIVVIALESGRPGVRGLFTRLVKVRIPWKWVLFVLLFPAVLSAAAVAVGWISGGMTWLDYRFLVPVSLAVPFLLFLIVCTGLAEELGWRGFALPYLQRSRTAERASWILGIAWGLWHLPSVVLLPLMTGAGNLLQAAFSLVGLTLGIVGYTIVLTWLYNNTGSLFWIVILHGYANAWQSYVVLSSGKLYRAGGLRGPALGPRGLAAEEVRRPDVDPPLATRQGTTPGSAGMIQRRTDGHETARNVTVRPARCGGP